MILSSPGETAFYIFGFPVYFYGITMAAAVLVCIVTAYFLYGRFYGKKNAEYIIDFSPYLIVIGILGARLYYCLLNFGYYAARPLEILDIRQGGLSVHGMIIVCIAALWGFAKFYKIPVLKLMDVFACGTVLGQSIGRWGNFFNSEAFGAPADFALKLFIPIEKRPYMYLDNEYFHPAFLYESVLDFLIFILLLLLFRRLSKHAGMTACFYLILYSAARIFVEHFRLDSVLNIGGFPAAQVVSAVIITAALISMPFIYKSGQQYS
ncbi:MAG: prolipoprotein diacylglyceryl transferase [Heliobacteriaceae bacterium]|jgi:phosphatidylglycerol:prolipoprotein diacylglycerol transferase|nr:prolipoprotein diacylglyceryl transferase [Heliobacteriaceae bacterium]